MRRRSLTGPLLLLLIGGLFLWRNMNSSAPIFDLVSQYWPFVLIVWGLLRLVEVLFSRDEGWRGSFTGGEVVLIVLICIAGLGVWHAHQYGFRFNSSGLQWFGEEFEYPVSARAAAAGMKRVVFENPRGNIKVTGADTQEITVSGHKMLHAYAHEDADRTNGNTPVEIVPQGDRLLVRTNQDRVAQNQRISDDLEVTVPRGLALEARGRTGDYEITDLNGDVELAGDRGDVRLARLGGGARVEMGRSELIRLMDVKGEVHVSGRGSDIEMENIAGKVTVSGAYMGALGFKNLAKPLQFEGARNTELHVQAVPGRLNMDLGQFSANGLTGPVRLVSGSRDVKLEQFTQSLEVETQRGDIELQPGSPVPAIEARSGVGRIDLILPEKAAFTLDAIAEHGDALNDYGPSIEQRREGRAATLKGKVGNGSTVHLTTNRGMVSVRKEGTIPSEPEVSTPPSPPEKFPKPSINPKNLKDSEIKM